MPQFDFSYYPSQVFWLVIIFGFLFFCLRSVILPRIGAVIEERRDRIANDMDMADAFSAKAQELSQLYAQELTTARKEALRLMAKIEDSMQKQIEEKLNAMHAQNAARIKQKEVEITQWLDQLQASQLAQHVVDQIVTRLLHQKKSSTQ